MVVYARPPVDCNSPPVRHPVTGEINCIKYPECCGQQNVPIDGWQSILVNLIALMVFAWFIRRRLKKKKL